MGTVKSIRVVFILFLYLFVHCHYLDIAYHDASADAMSSSGSLQLIESVTVIDCELKRADAIVGH